MDEILSHSMDFGCPFMQSFPARGAWIEMAVRATTLPSVRRSFPARGAWIEISLACLSDSPSQSFPARGAWIEIKRYIKVFIKGRVVPRKGSVD